MCSRNDALYRPRRTPAAVKPAPAFAWWAFAPVASRVCRNLTTAYVRADEFASPAHLKLPLRRASQALLRRRSPHSTPRAATASPSPP